MTETIFKVYIQPRASRNEVAGPYRDGIKIKITAPPVGGKANEGLLRFLAKELGIPPSHIEILKGHHSREKVLKIRGLSAANSLLSAANSLDFKKKND